MSNDGDGEDWIEDDDYELEEYAEAAMKCKTPDCDNVPLVAGQGYCSDCAKRMEKYKGKFNR